MGEKIRGKKINKREDKLLSKIYSRISEGGSLEEIFDSLFAGLQQFLPCDRLDIGFLEEDGQRVLLYYVKTDYDQVILNRGSVSDVAESFFLRALTAKEPITIDNLRKYGKAFENREFIDPLIKEGINSAIVSPIIIGDNVMGLLFCGSRREKAYPGRESEIITEILEDAAPLVERTYQLEQLERNYQSYMEMLGFVTHEIKSPLASIITLGETLVNGYFGKIEEKQRSIVERMIKKAEYLHTVSDEYLNLARFESNMLQLRPRLVDFLDEIAEPTLDIIMPQIEERRMSLRRNYDENVYPLKCDPDMIKIVLNNLLSNGVKYGNRGGVLDLTIERGYKRLKVSVKNEGPGFTQSEKSKLFRKFSRLQSSELVERKGTGIGLYVSWKIIQMHGGRIVADSLVGEWAQFTFELPQHMDMCIVD